MKITREELKLIWSALNLTEAITLVGEAKNNVSLSPIRELKNKIASEIRCSGRYGSSLHSNDVTYVEDKEES